MGFSASHLAIKLMLLILCSTSLCINGMSTSSKPRLFAKLIHRDSIYSPYYNPNGVDGPSQRARDLGRTFARLAYFESQDEGRAIARFNPTDDRAVVVPDDTGVEFLANISFGSRSNPQLIIMDTASPLMWIQCTPCKNCFRQQYPIYDPSMSTTYKPLPCDDKCPNNRFFSCDKQSNTCAYTIRYLDGSYSNGQMASEQLTFTTSDEGLVSVPNLLVGCGHDNKFALGDQTSGILGLSPANFSLPSQLGNIFSYCIGSLTDWTYAYNNLIIGEGAEIQGDSTGLESFNGFYYIQLEKISVGQTVLQFDPSALIRSASGIGGTIIDSGTTFTVLPRAAYDALRTETRRIIDERGLTFVPDPNQLCYRGSIQSDLDMFPLVSFQFAGGAELQLQTEAMFHQYGDQFCMNVVESKARNPKAVIGGRAQQFYNFGFDISNKKLYIQGVECSIFESRRNE